MEEEIALVIGDKAWSSWSLRPWLAAKVTGIPFSEVPVRLRQPDTPAQIARHSPSGHIPVLKRGGLSVWDSLAICEYLAELAPEARLWPAGLEARAVARSISAEMHSGFQALRMEFPMDFHARIEGRAASDKARADIARVVQIWSGMRRDFGTGGPFLFGGFHRRGRDVRAGRHALQDLWRRSRRLRRRWRRRSLRSSHPRPAADAGMGRGRGEGVPSQPLRRRPLSHGERDRVRGNALCGDQRFWVLSGAKP